MEIPISLKGAGRVSGLALSDVAGQPRTIAVDPGEPLTIINQLKYVRGRYYLTDYKNGFILVFDESGQVLLKMSNKGRAENEWVKMFCFDVNPSNGEIHVYDVARKSFVVYSEAGVFLRRVQVAEDVNYFDDFAVMDDGSYLIFKSRGSQEEATSRGLIALHQDGTVANVLVQLDAGYRQSKLYVPNGCYFHRLGDGTLSVCGKQDKNEIYHIAQDGTFSIAYHLDYDVVMPKEVLSMETSMSDAPTYYDVSYFFETDHWLSLLVGYQGERILVYYNKRTGETFTGKTQKDKLKLGDLVVRKENEDVAYTFSSGNRIMSVWNPSYLDPEVTEATIFVNVLFTK